MATSARLHKGCECWTEMFGYTPERIRSNGCKDGVLFTNGSAETGKTFLFDVLKLMLGTVRQGVLINWSNYCVPN